MTVMLMINLVQNDDEEGDKRVSDEKKTVQDGMTSVDTNINNRQQHKQTKLTQILSP